MTSWPTRQEGVTMRLGAVLPTYEVPADPRVLRDFAQAAEQMGYAHLTAGDHVLGADLAHRPHWAGRQSNLLRDFHEPLVLFGYLSGLVGRLEFATTVLVLPQRQTALFAKQAAEVDVLSQGRLRLGLGVGWVEPEFVALNEDYHTRGRRMDEQLALVRMLWTQEAVTYRGQWHQIDGMGIRPLPVQRPIPLWLGGDVEATFRRVVTLGEGWMALSPPDATAQQAVERLHTLAHAAGRDPASIGIEAMVFIAGKTPEEWRREALGWQALGATHLTVNTLDAGLESLEAHLETIRQFKEVVSSAT
jgi:probable F420-dependent oxidoreductase